MPETFEDDLEPERPARLPPTLTPRSRRRHTTAAAQEWLDYYRDRFVKTGPDIKRYKALLARNGFAMIRLPYAPGHPRFYDYLNEIPTLSEAAFILDAMVARMQEPKPPPASWQHLYAHRTSHPFINRPTVLDVELATEHRARLQRALWLRDAVACQLTLFLDKPENWLWMSQVMHPENVLLLLRELHAYAPPPVRPRLEKAWVDAGFISAQALRFLASRSQSFAATANRSTTGSPAALKDHDDDDDDEQKQKSPNKKE